MYSTARRAGRGTQICVRPLAGPHPVGREEFWPPEDLLRVVRPAADVTADIVGVVLLEPGRTRHMASQHAILEAWCEALDLALDPVQHVHSRSIGNMAVGPGGMLALRCAPAVEQAGLGEQYKGPFRVPSPRHVRLGGGDLVQGTAEMH